jgi:hypothetical protein
MVNRGTSLGVVSASAATRIGIARDIPRVPDWRGKDRRYDPPSDYYGALEGGCLHQFAEVSKWSADEGTAGDSAADRSAVTGSRQNMHSPCPVARAESGDRNSPFTSYRKCETDANKAQHGAVEQNARFELSTRFVCSCTAEFGAPCGIRTHGPRIRNPVLYPSELRGRGGFYEILVLSWSFLAKRSRRAAASFSITWSTIA